MMSTLSTAAWAAHPQCGLEPLQRRLLRYRSRNVVCRSSQAFGGEIDEETRNLILAKDALFVAAALIGLASTIEGFQLSRQAPEGATPIEAGTKPADDTPEAAARLLRMVNVLGM